MDKRALPGGQLKLDMVTFNGIPQNITSQHYFKAPHMVGRNSIYYLMYLYVKGTDATYQIKYSTRKIIFDPHEESAADHILATL